VPDEPAAKRPNLDAVDVVAPEKTYHESEAPFIVIPSFTDHDEPVAKGLNLDVVDAVAPKTTCHQPDAPSSAAPPSIDDNEPAAKRRKLDAVASSKTLVVKLPVVLPSPSSSSGAVRKYRKLLPKPYNVRSDWLPTAETSVQDSIDNADLPDNPIDIGFRTETAVLILDALQDSADNADLSDNPIDLESRTETAVLILDALQNSSDSETTGVTYGAIVRQISEGTDQAVNGAEFAGAVDYLERSSVVQVIGEGPRRRVVLLGNEIIAAVSSESMITDQDSSWTLLAQDDEAEDTAAQISATEAANKADGESNFASRIAQSRKCVDRIYAAADDIWCPDELAKVLKTVLETQFHSKNGELDESITASNNGFETVIRRDDILSLNRSEWLQDGLISALLTIMYPLGHTPERVQLLDTFEFNTLAMAAAHAQDLDTTPFRPFQFRDSVDEIVGVMNERGIHWFAFRIVKSTHTIEIYDSWVVKEDPAEQAERVAMNASILLMLVRHFASGDDAGDSWSCDDNAWKTELHSGTFTQDNSDDCGVHALRNVQDLLDAPHRVLPYHDAKCLRHRFAVLLSKVLQGNWKWGDQLPGEEQLRREWQRRATRSVQAFDAIDEDVPTEDVVPALDAQLPLRQAIWVILGSSAEPLTVAEIAQRYMRLSKHLGVPCSPWPVVLNSVRCYLYRNRGHRSNVERIDILPTNTYRIKPERLPFVRSITTGDLAFFSQGGWRHLENTEATSDDIDTRPKLIVVPWRMSRARPGFANIADKAKNDTSEVTDYWNLVHNGRPESATDLADADGLDLASDEFYVHQYLLPPPRSSSTPLFESPAGQPTDQDVTCAEILAKLDSDAASRNVHGDDRPLVTWLLAGVDCVCTHMDS
jgi:hypothetical protein